MCVLISLYERVSMSARKGKGLFNVFPGQICEHTNKQREMTDLMCAIKDFYDPNGPWS